MRLFRSFPAALAAAVLAVPAHAQQWSGPLFSSPLVKPKWEVFVGDAYGSGAGMSVAVRPFGRGTDLRIRAGIADGLGTGPLEGRYYDGRETYALSAGIDYSAPLAANAEGLVRADWVAGIGVASNGGARITAPLGITLGYNGDRIRPYVTPRVVLEHRADPPPYNSGTTVSAVVDWGVDIMLPRGGVLRAAVTTGSWRGVGLGISF